MSPRALPEWGRGLGRTGETYHQGAGGRAAAGGNESIGTRRMERRGSG